jgi:hypothetical protein
MGNEFKRIICKILSFMVSTLVIFPFLLLIGFIKFYSDLPSLISNLLVIILSSAGLILMFSTYKKIFNKLMAL